MKPITCCLCVALAAGAGAAWAQTRPSPGLWEHSTRMKSGSGEMEAAMAKMQDQLAAMPPEQRKQMEQAMTRQGMGLSAPSGQPGLGFKVCLTADKAARDEVPLQESTCKQTGNSRSGNTVKFRFECSEPRKATGEGEVTYVSSKEHRGKLKLTAVRGAREETMEMETSARWLGADCGEVKPRP